MVFVAACRRKEVWEGGGHTESSGGQMWKLRHLDGTIDLVGAGGRLEWVDILNVTRKNR